MPDAVAEGEQAFQTVRVAHELEAQGHALGVPVARYGHGREAEELPGAAQDGRPGDRLGVCGTAGLGRVGGRGGPGSRSVPVNAL
ncbi:hypothetical protein ACWCQW_34650 [Streptomyces mirabilis]